MNIPTSPPKMRGQGRQGHCQFHENYTSLSQTHVATWENSLENATLQIKLFDGHDQQDFHCIAGLRGNDRAFQIAIQHMSGPSAKCKFLPELILNRLFLIAKRPGCDVNVSVLLGVVCSLTKLGSRVWGRIQVEKSTEKYQCFRSMLA
jgi:hypothetical protein